MKQIEIPMPKVKTPGTIQKELDKLTEAVERMNRVADILEKIAGKKWS